MNGFDGSLMASINAMQPYHDYFHVGDQGSGTGIVFAIYSVGGMVGTFSQPPPVTNLVAVSACSWARC